jgi:hypothetical protein
MDIFARDARAMAKMREGVPLTAYTLPRRTHLQTQPQYREKTAKTTH